MNFFRKSIRLATLTYQSGYGMSIKNMFIGLFLSFFIVGESGAYDINAEMTAKNTLNSTLQRFCKGRPKINIGVIEEISRRLSVNPNSIGLNRVELIWATDALTTIADSNSGVPEANKFKPYGCEATLYSPVGSNTCKVNFDERGVIAEFCGIGSNSYTNNLYLNYFRIHTANMPPAPKTENPYGMEFDLGTGNCIKNCN